MEIVRQNIGSQSLVRIRQQLQTLSDLYGEMGISMEPFSSPSKSRLKWLDQHKLSRIEACLDARIKLAQVTREQGIVSDPAACTRVGLNYLELSMDADVLDKIKDGDVVEFYDSSSFCQIFHNYEFMKICSYTIEDILTYEFWELYERPEIVTSQIAVAANKIFSGRSNIEISSTPEHTLSEIWSHSKSKMKIKQGFLAPLYDSNQQITALIATLRAQLT